MSEGIWEMKRAFFSFVLLAFAASAVLGSGWKRIRVAVPDAAAAQRVSDCTLGLYSDFVTLGTTDLILGPGQEGELLRLMLPWVTVSELPDPKDWASRYGGGAEDDYRTQYLRYDQIIAQYEVWRTQNPTRVSRQQIGTSIQGRPIWAYLLHGPRPPQIRVLPTLPSTIKVILTAGVHAREWISPPVQMYIFEQLLERSKVDYEYAMLSYRTYLYVVPVQNPDGYEYTWTNNRYWRKNRRNNGNGTYGVDVNRNYAKGWGGQGSSGNTGADTYRGTAPFSEPEAVAVRDLAIAVGNARGFVDYHSYGELVLYPWGYTTASAPDSGWLHTVGLAYRNAMTASGGHTYTLGQTSTTLYVASGVSNDWLYDQFRTAAYAVELRGTDFVLPTSQILPTCEENWAGFDAWLRSIL